MTGREGGHQAEGPPCVKAQKHSCGCPCPHPAPRPLTSQDPLLHPYWGSDGLSQMSWCWGGVGPVPHLRTCCTGSPRPSQPSPVPTPVFPKGSSSHPRSDPAEAVRPEE